MAESIPRSSFGSALRARRLAAGLTQEDLAERASLSARGISDLERGARRRPHPATARLLADALAIPDSERSEFFAEAHAGSAGRPVRPPSAVLLGRGRLVRALSSALEKPSQPIVTLVGAADVGKTSIALAVAEAWRQSDGESVHVVYLAELRESGQVLAAVAAAFGLADSSDSPIRTRILAHLRDRSGLLVMDNFEHLLSAAPVLADLVQAAPRLRILVTSRSPLHLLGERVVPVPPLRETDAVRLFMQRASARGAGALGPPSAVKAICWRLDRLPLAIELAAASTSVLPPQALLARLERPLDVLTQAPRDSPDRHQTLRRTLGWSYRLLDAPAQALLDSCSVFVGGWTLEAAEALDPGGAGTLARLGALVDLHLVRRTAGDSAAQPRFDLLETIREFATECLAARGAAHSARHRPARPLRAAGSGAPAGGGRVRHSGSGAGAPAPSLGSAAGDPAHPRHRSAGIPVA